MAINIITDAHDRVVVALAFARVKRAAAAAWPVQSKGLLALWDGIIARHEAHLADLNNMLEAA